MTLRTYCRTNKEPKNYIMTFEGQKAKILTAFLSKTPKFGSNGDFHMKYWHLIPIGGGFKKWFGQSQGTHFGPQLRTVICNLIEDQAASKRRNPRQRKAW